jgi:acetyl esterase/lipase
MKLMRPLPLLLSLAGAALMAAEPRLDVPYLTGGSPAQRLDFYPPASGDRAAPLVLWIHGGAWLGGNKRQCPAQFLTRHGYAVASLGYRLSPEAIFPAQIHDVKAALRFLRANADDYGFDPARVGVWGASAGGHLAALLGASGGVPAMEGTLGVTGLTTRVQAVVNYFGPADLLTFGAQAGPRSRINHNAPDAPEARLIGGAVPDHPEKARAASPVTYVSADDPPMLHVHGDEDDVVPFAQSEQLHAALTSAGAPSTLRRVPGGGHGNRFPPELRDEVRAFFDRHLRLPAP